MVLTRMRRALSELAQGPRVRGSQVLVRSFSILEEVAGSSAKAADGPIDEPGPIAREIVGDPCPTRGAR